MHRSGYRLPEQHFIYHLNKDMVVYASDFVKENETKEQKPAEKLIAEMNDMLHRSVRVSANPGQAALTGQEWSVEQ